MGCDLLALDLVRHWEFLRGPPSVQAAKEASDELQENGVDYSKMLRRRSSLVVADMPIKAAEQQTSATPSKPEQQQPKPKPKPPPTSFTEPDANSLLDSFGF